MALALDLTETFDESEIVNDKRAGGDRHSPWMDGLVQLAEASIDGTVPSGKFVKLAQFGAASGARARIKQLTAEGVELPCAEYGKFSFKPNTWIGPKDDAGVQKRHSTLWAAFTVVNPPVDEDEYEPDDEDEPEVD